MKKHIYVIVFLTCTTEEPQVASEVFKTKKEALRQLKWYRRAKHTKLHIQELMIE